MPLKEYWKTIAPTQGFASLRIVTQRSERMSCRRGVIQPPASSMSHGAMITIVNDGGYGYAATTDVSYSGLKNALDRAQQWAAISRGRLVHNLSQALQSVDRPCDVVQEYVNKPVRPWKNANKGELMDVTQEACNTLKTSQHVSYWMSELYHRHVEQRLLTNTGCGYNAAYEVISPRATVVVSRDGVTVHRTFFANDLATQGGLEKIDELGYQDHMSTLAQEAHILVSAPMCPEEKLDLLIHPDQMHLQIHESIGHPIELDRILGDERNYAGTSFVSKEMIGSYQYGSSLLNITFDPTDITQLASYQVDDDGMPARREFLIEKGVLKQAIGG